MNPLISTYLKALGKSTEKKVQYVFNFDELKEAWIETGLTKHTEFEFDQVSELILRTCFLAPTKKGAIFCGTKGIGKSLNLDVFSMINTHLFKKATECYEVAEIELQYKVRGAAFIEHLTDLPCLVINDADTSRDLNDFGTVRNIVTDILFLRYRNFQTKGYKTYLTTNLEYEFIVKEFGDRLQDRFNEMFFGVGLKGKSRR